MQENTMKFRTVKFDYEIILKLYPYRQYKLSFNWINRMPGAWCFGDWYVIDLFILRGNRLLFNLTLDNVIPRKYVFAVIV